MIWMFVLGAALVGVGVRLFSRGTPRDPTIVEAILSYPMLLLAAIYEVGSTTGQRDFTPTAAHGVSDAIYVLMVIPIAAHATDFVIKFRRGLREVRSSRKPPGTG